METLTSPLDATVIAPALPMPPRPLVDRLLRDGDALTLELGSDPLVGRHVGPLAALAAAGAGVFGLCLGLQAGLPQALLSGVKMPLIVLGSAALSLPEVFTILFDNKMLY